MNEISIERLKNMKKFASKQEPSLSDDHTLYVSVDQYLCLMGIEADSERGLAIKEEWSAEGN